MLKQKLQTVHTLTTKQVMLLVIAGIFGLFAVITPLVRADQFSDKIKELQAQNAANQAQANVLQAQADTYQQAIDQLQTQMNALQAQIDANTAKSNELQAQITAAEAELAQQRKILGESIRSMYLEGQISTLEMLASSKDLSDFVDKQQYRNSVQNKIKTTVDKIADLKAKLRAQKEQVEALLKEQQAMQGQLASDRNKQAEMLAYTEGQKSQFEAQIRATNAEIAQQRAQQAAFYASLTGGGSRNYGTSGSFSFRSYVPGGYCGGGYDYCWAGLDQWVDDSWGLHYARECVHYAADRAFSGVNLSGYFGNGRGNATNWPSSLGGRYRVDQSPEVGAVAIKLADPSRGDYYGHAMYVEYVGSDGWVGVSQMNWGPAGSFSTMEVKASGVLFIHP